MYHLSFGTSYTGTRFIRHVIVELVLLVIMSGEKKNKHEFYIYRFPSHKPIFRVLMGVLGCLRVHFMGLQLRLSLTRKSYLSSWSSPLLLFILLLQGFPLWIAFVCIHDS
jgi:hypothetical protein